MLHSDTNMSPQIQRHFTFKHPLFKRHKSASGEWWEDSVYYFWWEFLRRHDGYKRTCDNGGNGKYSKLYSDFGNVHGISFKEWWTKDDRGARLFSEPPLLSNMSSFPHSVKVLTPKELENLLGGWDSGSLLVVAIPLGLRKGFIERKLRKLVARYNKRKPGERTIKESKALYPITTGFNTHNLEQILKIYDLRQAQPELTLWEIGHRFNLDGQALNKDELEGGRGRQSPGAVEKKRILAVAAHKKLKHAKSIIEGVGRGVFPAFSKST
jgi:hypothetical protein